MALPFDVGRVVNCGDDVLVTNRGLGTPTLLVADVVVVVGAFAFCSG